MLGGIVEAVVTIFNELGDKGRAFIIMLSIFALGAAAAVGGMTWYNLPEKAEANKVAIDSLGVRLEQVEQEVEANSDHQANISRRLEIMCRELLDNPEQCDLRFNPDPVNVNSITNPTPQVNNETQQEMRESGVREFRPGQRGVLSELPISSGGEGT